MLDWIFATISMLAVIAFMGVVLAFVPEPDLIVVTVTVLVIGIVFIWRDLRAGNSHIGKGAGKDNAGG